ncbi:RNA polymerase sigma factor [Eggerthella sinensis]|uniref:RNA polymerase sigma factor n=1 Tax=Eggerthella sinensis TaxID=242230 RepID=UPI0022E7EC04|nr:sigma-70 family RNA polymerase sigma factor [Eggerthella sinensis]
MRRTRSDTSHADGLVHAYADLILRLSYTYLASTHDAEDICQNVLIKLLKREAPFESAEHERAWVIRTTANACKDVLRSGWRRTTVELEAAPEPTAPEPPDSPVLEAVRRTTVELEAAPEPTAPEPPDSPVLEAVMSLPEAYRAALYLHYYEGYTAREIAAMTESTEDAVAARLSRGRKKLPRDDGRS